MESNVCVCYYPGCLCLGIHAVVIVLSTLELDVLFEVIVTDASCRKGVVGARGTPIICPLG